MQSATAKIPTLFPISAPTIAEGLRDIELPVPAANLPLFAGDGCCGGTCGC
jgi:hypothetical protein